MRNCSWQRAFHSLRLRFLLLQGYVKEYKYLFIILSIAMVYRVLFQLPYDIPVGWDTPHYIYTLRIYTENFSQGIFSVFPLDPYQGSFGVGASTKFPGLFIGLAFFCLITNVDPYTVMLVLPILLYLLATVSIYLFGSTIMNKRVGYFSALLWSLSPEALRISWDLQMNMLGMTLLMLFSSVFIRWLKEGRMRLLILSLMLFSIATLTHDFSYFLGFSLLLLFSIQMVSRDRKKAMYCFSLFVVLSILFIPFHMWYYNNRIVTDDYVEGALASRDVGFIIGYPISIAFSGSIIICLLMRKGRIELQFLATSILISLCQIFLLPPDLRIRGLFNLSFIFYPALISLIDHYSEKAFNQERKELKGKVFRMKISRQKARSLILLTFIAIFTASSSYNVINSALRPLLFKDYVIMYPGPVMRPHERDAILYFGVVTTPQEVLITPPELINWVIVLISRPTWSLGEDNSISDALGKGYNPYIFESRFTQSEYGDFSNNTSFRLFYNVTDVRIWEYIPKRA